MGIRNSLAIAGVMVLAACGSNVERAEGPSVTLAGRAADAPTRATGGGHIRRAGAKVTFAFEAQSPASGADGRMEVHDHGTGERFKGRVTVVTCIDGVVNLAGVLEEPADGTFSAVVTDAGEPGTYDAISFTTNAGYTASGILEGGNVQTSGVCLPAKPSPTPSPVPSPTPTATPTPEPTPTPTPACGCQISGEGTARELNRPAADVSFNVSAQQTGGTATFSLYPATGAIVINDSDLGTITGTASRIGCSDLASNGVIRGTLSTGGSFALTINETSTTSPGAIILSANLPSGNVLAQYFLTSGAITVEEGPPCPQ